MTCVRRAERSEKIKNVCKVLVGNLDENGNET
jgi:hypothetical protein